MPVLTSEPKLRNQQGGCTSQWRGLFPCINHVVPSVLTHTTTLQSLDHTSKRYQHHNQPPSTMVPLMYFSLALGALADVSVASPIWSTYPTSEYPSSPAVQPYYNNTLYTYTSPGCDGCAFVFHDFQPNVCAVTITRSGFHNISEAIAARATLVKSGLLVRNETGYNSPNFVAWSEGPESNVDGPLQCGTIRDEQVVTGNQLCLSAPDGVFDHGYSYYRQNGTQTGSSSSVEKRDATRCTERRQPDAVWLNGKMYTLQEIPESAKMQLLSLTLNGGGEVSAELDVYRYSS
jgi:hypothetical protein